MGEDAKILSRRALAEFLEGNGHVRAVDVDGEVIQKALPSGGHADVQGSVFRVLATSFRRPGRSNG